MPTVEGESFNGFLRRLGKIPRFVKPSSEIDINEDWIKFINRNGYSIALTHQPAPISYEIERNRIRDYGLVDPTNPSLNEASVDLAINWLYEHFHTCHNPVILADFNIKDPRELAANMAYNSIQFLIKSHSKSKRKSPGYPWNSPSNPLGKVFKTKLELIEDPGFFKILADYIYGLLTGRPTYTYMAECLKDEIVTCEKAISGRTRIFMSASIEHFLASLVLFGPMHESFIAGNDSTYSTAGSDYHRGKWDSKIRLFPYGMFISGDFKNYDVYLRSLFFRVLYTFFSKTHADHWDVLEPMIRALLQQACCSLFVDSQGNVYMKATGNPSGQYLTLLFNTLMLYFMNAMFYIDCVDHSKPTFGLERSDFEFHVKLWLCGDDQVHNISPLIQDQWTPTALINYWTKTMGMVMKTAHSSTDFCEVEFCGKTSQIQNGMYVPVPRIDKFMSSMQYKTIDNPLIQIERMRSLLMDLYTRPDLQRILLKYLDHYYADILEGRYTLHPLYGRQTLPTRQAQKKLWLGL